MDSRSVDAGPVLLTAISVTLLILTTVVASYVVPPAAGNQGPGLVISDVTVSRSGSLISFTVLNTGASTVRLSATLGALESSTTFSSPTLAPGDNTTGRMTLGNVSNFNGQNASVTVSNSSGLNFPEFTVEIGLELRSFAPDRQMIVEKGVSPTGGLYFYSYRSVNNINDLVVLSNGTRTDYQLGNVLRTGTWYDLAYSVGRGLVVAYLNGQAIDSWPLVEFALSNDSSPFLIGNCDCGPYFFNGSLSFVRLYSRPLSASEVWANYLDPTSTSGAGLEFSLSFNGSGGGPIPDLSGNGHTGVGSNVLSASPGASGGMALLSVVGTTLDGAVFPVSTSVPLGEPS